MKFYSLLFFLLVVLGLNAQMIDKNSSTVEFEVDNMFRSVKGTIGGMQGSLSFDTANLGNSFFSVCIEAATINTENEKRDNHLKSEDFFGVDSYPLICFTSNEVVRTQDSYMVKGELTMHGITKIVEIPFTFDRSGWFEGTLTVNRRDYKIGDDTGKFMVGEEVTLKIKCVLTKQ